MELKLNIDFEVMPPSRRLLVIILPSLIIAALFIYLIIMPTYEERSKLKAELNKQEQDIQLARQQAARLPALIAENERLKIRLLELQAQLPEEKEISGLLRQVSQLGVTSGLDVVLWRPKERVVHPSKEVYEIPVDVEMRGSYHRLGQFYSRITRLPRIVNISNINMKPADEKFQQKQAKILHVSFIAKTYSLIPEQEKKEIEKKEKEQKK